MAQFDSDAPGAEEHGTQSRRRFMGVVVRLGIAAGMGALGALAMRGSGDSPPTDCAQADACTRCPLGADCSRPERTRGAR